MDEGAMRSVDLVLAAMAAATTLLIAGPQPARAAEPHARLSMAFEFDDARLLAKGQTKSAWIHLAGRPGSAPRGAELPLVVFLHGLNPGAQQHVWMGGGRADLRASADRVAARAGAFLFAAPSQTRHAAAARSLWDDFDLDAFIEAADRTAFASKARVHVDARRVFLVGHSGAGCDVDNGIFTPLTKDDEAPRAILAIDTCLDDDIGRSAARTQRIVWMTWQETEWPRDPTGAMRGFFEEVDPENVELLHMERMDVPGPDAHNAILPLAFERILPNLLRLE
jgi:hypothetical protein